MLFVVKTCSALSLLVWSSFKGITYSHYYHYYYYFCYLGSWIATSSKDINIRKAQAWTAINKLSKIWKAPQLSRELKIHVFRTTVEAILHYGSQCWTFTVAQERSLDGTYTRLLLKALNISYKDHIPNITLYGSLAPISSTTPFQMTTVCRTLFQKSRGAHPFCSIFQISWYLPTRWTCSYELR